MLGIGVFWYFVFGYECWVVSGYLGMGVGWYRGIWVLCVLVFERGCLVYWGICVLL